MAIREVRIDKAINGVIAHLVRGDSRTQIIRLEIDRYDGGVDLAGLAWCIKVVNAAGASDVFPVDPVATDEQMLAIDWLVSGVATAVAGHTKVALEGASDADGEAVVWRSGVGLIHVREDLDAIPSEDDEQLTALQMLILHVRNELEGVIAAGQAAEKAAAEADAARVNVETAEAERADAEAGRADAEERRADAEAQRNAAEAGRLAAEERRASAESGRIDAENARVSAEEQRVSAEAGREQTWATLKSEAEAATSAASEAATAANALTPVIDGLKDDLADKEPLHKVLSATLVTGETMLTITHDEITDNAMIYIYTNVWGVQPSAVEQSGNTLTLTFDAQSADLGVKVEVR